LLHLDQSYLKGIAKRKSACLQLEPALREAVRRRAVAVVESAAHELKSRPGPDLGLRELLRDLSGGARLPVEDTSAFRQARRRMAWTIDHELPYGDSPSRSRSAPTPASPL
jgi:hypothetical protein